MTVSAWPLTFVDNIIGFDLLTSQLETAPNIAGETDCQLTLTIQPQSDL